MKAISLILLVMAGGVTIPQESGSRVTGIVKLKGEPPKTRTMKIACPLCAPLYPQGMPREDLTLGKQGEIQGAFVIVKAGLEGKKYDLPEGPVSVEMKGCRFEPHVLGLRAGQKLRLRNQDPHNHCVHAIPFDNREFNIALVPGMEVEKALEKPEAMVRLKDDVYPWMSAWIGVVDHPFFAVTGTDGKFEIKGLPPGRYTIEVWQEKSVPATQRVEIGENESKSLEFALELKKE